MLTRYNRKTVMVITDDGQRWNVAPILLDRAEPPERGEVFDANVVQFRRE